MNHKEILEYLDSSIRKWRAIFKDKNHEYSDIAIYYCDAFQSIRVSIFGELLPKDDEPDGDDDDALDDDDNGKPDEDQSNFWDNRCGICMHTFDKCDCAITRVR